MLVPVYPAMTTRRTGVIVMLVPLDPLTRSLVETRVGHYQGGGL
jgi:hypothetical protein